MRLSLFVPSSFFLSPIFLPAPALRLMVIKPDKHRFFDSAPVAKPAGTALTMTCLFSNRATAAKDPHDPGIPAPFAALQAGGRWLQALRLANSGENRQKMPHAPENLHSRRSQGP